MRLLYVCRAPIHPGTVTESHVLGVVSAWAREGHPVVLWAPNAPRGCPVPFRVLTLGGIEARVAACWRGTIRETKPDAVYFRWCVGEGPALVRAARRLGVPCFAEINGILAEELPAWDLVGRLRAFRAEGRTARLATGVVVPTAGVRSHLVAAHGLPPGKVLAVGNGVDPEAFPPMSARECRARLGLDAGLRWVGFVGNFQPWHGAELLVSAFALVARDDPKVRLLMVGEGPSREAAERAAAQLGCGDRILWKGRVLRGDVPAHINALDVPVVLWSPVRRDPGSSVKLLEYMACARPIVATDVPEYAEPVLAARAGEVVPVGDAAGVARGIRALLDLPEAERRAMGGRGRDYVRAHRTWTHAAAEILAFMGEKKPA